MYVILISFALQILNYCLQPRVHVSVCTCMGGMKGQQRDARDKQKIIMYIIDSKNIVLSE